jgi:hypothetical protein
LQGEPSPATNASSRSRRFAAAAAGLLLLAGVALVARELFVAGGVQPGRPAPANVDSAPSEPLAGDAAADKGDPSVDDARLALAAARRLEPRASKSESGEAADADALDTRRGGFRRARPESERWYLERCRAVAARDVVAFESSAKETLAKPAPLAEKVAWLLAARELGRERYDAMVDRALDEGRRADPRLRVAAVVLLERDARRSAPASLRLLRAIALAPKDAADPPERARAASDAFAFADEAGLSEAVDLVADADPALRADVLRGLARNPRPAAAAHRERLVSLPGWRAAAEQVASTAATADDESNE